MKRLLHQTPLVELGCCVDSNDHCVRNRARDRFRDVFGLAFPPPVSVP
jgi:hypothetical protein